MALLYVNADDFGLHPAVNEAIAKCVEAGSVNSISVMANGKAPDFQLLRQLQTRGALVGAHITWVNEQWLTQPYNFFSWKELLMKFVAGGNKFREEARQEADEQIHQLLNEGIKLQHIDSHQHVHVFPGLWETTVKLQHKYCIDRIRVPSVKDLSLTRGNVAGMVMQMLAFTKQPTHHTLYCAGIKHAGNYDLPLLKKELEQSAGNDTILIVHPGNNNQMLNQQYAHWDFDWEKEYAALTDKRFLEMVDTNGFTLAIN